jgi:hypothetical protein
LQAGAVSGDGAFDGGGQVVPDVPPVGDLQRFGCAETGAFGVCAGTVPAHDLHSRIRPQPRGQCLGGAIGEYVDRTARLDVDQHRAVDVSAPQGEVVDAQHPHNTGRRVRQRPYQPHQRHPAHVDGHVSGQPCAGPAAECQRDALQHPAQADAAATVPGGQPGDLLDERRPHAVLVAAEQPPHPQVDHRFPPTDHEIGQSTLVATVHPARHEPAGRARHSLVVGGGLDPHRPTSLGHLLDPQAEQMGEHDTE